MLEGEDIRSRKQKSRSAKRKTHSLELKLQVLQQLKAGATVSDVCRASLRGLCGARALACSAGVSRRQAARVKREVMTELERERIAGCSRVLVHEPGVLRNLDQLYIGRRPAQQVALIASDAAVPYRTSARLVPCYSASEVARVLVEDFERHGPPLAMRMDRASQHDAGPVRELLRKHEVLMLHGPARYPQYYGQHERQNREHQAGWHTPRPWTMPSCRR